MKSSVDVAWENAIRDPDVQSHITEQRIKWLFIIQLSPWMGGFYEKLAGISKMALQKANRKNMPHNVTTPNLFDRNSSSY